MHTRDIKRILLPTDFSENSRSAFPAAVSWARRHDAVLHLFHVVTPLPWPAHRVMEEKKIPMLNDEIRRRSEKRLRELASELGTEARCEVHVVEGSAAEQVERFVERQGMDLIVLSTQGHTGFKRFRLGSTTERIVRTAECPVLVVRPTTSWDKLTKVIVPIDFSKLSQLALQEGAELARAHGAQLVLVHVLEETEYPVGRVLKGHGILDFRDQMEKGARAQLERLRTEKADAADSSDVVVREGVPSATIADLAEEMKAELIVLATHGREGLARFVLGSTAERVVRIAPCSVLVVKERGA